MNTLGDLLKDLRGKRSLRKVQEDTGISHTYLSTLEKGYDPRTKKERKPSFDVLKKLAEYYDYSYTKLLEEAGYLEPGTYERNIQLTKHVSENTEEWNKKLQNFTRNVDLHELLTDERKVTYKQKTLNKKEKNKIIKFIDDFL